MKKCFYPALLITLQFFSVFSHAKPMTKVPSFIVPNIYNYGDQLFVSVWNHFSGPVVCSGQIHFQSMEGREHRFFYEEVPPRLTSTYSILPENPETEILSFSHDVLCY